VPLLELVEVCGRQVKVLWQMVIVVAATVTMQECKVLVAHARERGLVVVLKAAAAKVVPSWFYSLHDHTVKELLEVVEDVSVPAGKRIKALNRLAAHAGVSSEQCDHVCCWGGLAILIDIMTQANQNADLLDKATQVLRTLCRSRSAADSLIRDRIRTDVMPNDGSSGKAEWREGGSRDAKQSVTTGGAAALASFANTSALGGGQQAGAVGLRALVALLDDKKYKAKIVINALGALYNIAECGAKGAEGVVTTAHATERLVELLSSRTHDIRTDAARLVGLVAQSTFTARLTREESLRLDFLGGRGLRERRTALKDLVQVRAMVMATGRRQGAIGEGGG